MRVTAARATAAAANTDEPIVATAYEQQLMQLAQDKRQLSGIQSTEKKAEAKREMLPKYAAWVDGVLSSGRGVQDDVVMTVLVWRIDAGDYLGALPIATHAIQYGLKMPEPYTRTTACVIAEEYAEMAKKARANNGPVDLMSLEAIARITDDQDMPDQVRAKLYKEIGFAQIERAPEAALARMKRAMELDKNVGVKKEIERLETKIKNQTSTDAGNGDG
ncbi:MULTISPECIES: phage terminase small subunit [Pandoraea]|uniref:phage terminase small subunit n=1 Tax=Pandoraea TaxID=93217 RepID=UPI001F5D5126|nr:MULTISPECIES: phage terminase small subunit [Pandoraea]